MLQCNQQEIIFRELQQRSQNPIPHNQRDECTKLLIQALQTSSSQQQQQQAERLECKAIIKGFFIKLKEVMSVQNMLEVEKVVQNSVLWFLAPFW